MMESAHKRCIVNLGMYKTGTTSLAAAAKSLSLKVYDEFPHVTSSRTLKEFLIMPTQIINDHIMNNIDSLTSCLQEHDFVSDGFFSLLPLASEQAFDYLKEAIARKGIKLDFVATERDLKSYLKSDLHHWVRNDLEDKTKLTLSERFVLEDLLRVRYQKHQDGVERLSKTVNITRLNIIHDQDSCVQKMCKLRSKYEWKRGFETAGIQNIAPALPKQAILLTMRIVKDHEKCLQDVILLLDGIERDPLCTYVLYLAIDDDEYDDLQYPSRKGICVRVD